MFVDIFLSIFRSLNAHNLFSCLYDFNWQGIIEGEKCSGGGRGTSVLILEDGQWKIITEHLGPFAS